MHLVTGTRALCAFLTVENLADTITGAGVPAGLDLLSIDVDGVDYWLWESLTCVSPRVVVIEYNASFGPHRSITVPYESGFDRVEKHPSTFYHGASLSALAKLGAKKGYSLVGCDSNGVNAFFVRNDLIKSPLAALFSPMRPTGRIEVGLNAGFPRGAVRRRQSAHRSLRSLVLRVCQFVCDPAELSLTSHVTTRFGPDRQVLKLNGRWRR